MSEEVLVTMPEEVTTVQSPDDAVAAQLGELAKHTGPVGEFAIGALHALKQAQEMVTNAKGKRKYARTVLRKLNAAFSKIEDIGKESA